MAQARDLVIPLEEEDQRKKFRRYVEDNPGVLGKWFNEDFNLNSIGRFSSSTLESYFVGWCMYFDSRRSGGSMNRLGYVKTKLDSRGLPFVTSFSAVPAEDHVPIRLDD